MPVDSFLPDQPGARAGAAADARMHAGAPAAAHGQASAPSDAGTVIDAARLRHWRSTRRLSTALLLLWLTTTFGAVFFARELAGLTLFGWPLSFYLAAQGASLVYLAILATYAWRMRRFDRRYHAGLPPELPQEGPQ